jgi:alcohol dehydrogenase
VVAVDRTPAALALARNVGAEHTVLADGGDVAAQVQSLTGGGSHVSVDAVGSATTCADAIHSLRRRGRHVQVGLLPSVGGHPTVPMDRVIAWELDVLGSHGMASVDYPAMLRLVEAGTLRPQSLVERVVGLAEGARLLPSLDTAAPVGVTLIDPRLP